LTHLKLNYLVEGDGQQMELVAREDQPFQDVAGKPPDVTDVPALRQQQGRQTWERRAVLAGGRKVQSQSTVYLLLLLTL